MPRYAALAAFAAVLALGGCSLFGSGEDEQEGAAAEQAPQPSYDSVDEVAHIEIGRTRDGLVITAYGVVPSLGFAAPELRPRRDGQVGPDGYLDFDFVARVPAEPATAAAGPMRTRMLRADHLLPIRRIQGARGIRIHAAEGGMMMNF